MTDLPSILDLLDLEYVEQDLYLSRAVYEAPWGMFGGQAAAVSPGRPMPDLEAEPVSDLPSPGSLPVWTHPKHPSFEFRPADPDRRLPTQFWIRCLDELPDDSLLHAAVVAYTSDISSALIPFETERTMAGPSLDHAVWFHRPARADGWIWQQLTPQTVSSGRGWYTATIYAADGTRIASVAQEQIFTTQRQR